MQQEQEEEEEEEHFRKIFEDALQDYDPEGEEEEEDDNQEAEDHSQNEIQNTSSNRDYHHMLMAMANQLLAEKFENQQLDAAIKLSMNQNPDNA